MSIASPQIPAEGLPTASPALHISSADRGAFLAYSLILVYASLKPFAGWRLPDAFTFLSWPRYIIAFDVLINVVAYLPFAAMLATFLDARKRPGWYPAYKVWWHTVLISAFLSLSFELLQSLLPGRISSVLDLLANATGAALGATLVLAAPGKRLLAHYRHWRQTHFFTTTEVDWGLILVVAWIVAQSNPAIPFFEAGHIVEPLTASAAHPYDPLILLPQAIGIMLNVCGFALFVALLMRPGRFVMFNIMLLLASGFALKVVMAALMLKAPQLIDWLAPARVIGVVAGFLLALFFVRVSKRWRTLSATLFVFAGGLMAKITSVYGAFNETLRLFNWPHGQLVNFTNITLWLHETWPLFAVLFLAWLFVTHHE